MNTIFKPVYRTLFLFITIVLFSCNTSPENLSKKFNDASYKAKIEYFNPNTKTKSEYSLYVDVKNNKVIVIHFENGDWLDESHIVSGGELNPEGNTTLFTDKGYEYNVSLID
jgi:hypothetical protein